MARASKPYEIIRFLCLSYMFPKVVVQTKDMAVKSEYTNVMLYR